MHPRTREVRAPESGIDPRGSGTGQPPLLQGFLKRRKGQRPAAARDASSTPPVPPPAGAEPATSEGSKRPRRAAKG